MIDTSNYYPFRDGRIDAIEAGQIESLWVAEQMGWPIAKAWNAIGSASLAAKGTPSGSPYRIAIPVAADRDRDREVSAALIEAQHQPPLTWSALHPGIAMNELPVLDK